MEYRTYYSVIRRAQCWWGRRPVGQDEDLTPGPPSSKTSPQQLHILVTISRARDGTTANMRSVLQILWRDGWAKTGCKDLTGNSPLQNIFLFRRIYHIREVGNDRKPGLQAVYQTINEKKHLYHLYRARDGTTANMRSVLQILWRDGWAKLGARIWQETHRYKIFSYSEGYIIYAKLEMIANLVYRPYTKQ